MKVLTLLYARFRQHYAQNKFIFMMFLIGVLASGFALIYFYGNTISYKRYFASSNVELRSYTIRFAQQQIFSPNQFAKLNEICRESGMNQSQIYMSNPILKNNFSGLDPQRIDRAWNPNMPAAYSIRVAAFWPNVSGFTAFMGRSTFSPEELSGKSRVAILPVSFLSADDLDQQVFINNNFFTVVGAAGSSLILIPFQTYLDCGFVSNQVNVVLDRILPTETEANFVQSLKTIFPDSIVQDTSQMRKNLQMKMIQELPQIGLMYLCSLLSFLFLMKYMVDKLGHENTVYAMLGASKRKVVCLLLLEIILWITSINILCIIVYQSLYTPLFSKLNMLDGITYDLTDYILILLIAIVTAFLSALPFIWKYGHSSLIVSKNQYQSD